MEFLDLFGYLGLFIFIYNFVMPLLRFVLSFFGKKLQIEEFIYGWVVITGATDGIGKEWAN